MNLEINNVSLNSKIGRPLGVKWISLNGFPFGSKNILDNFDGFEVPTTPAFRGQDEDQKGKQALK